jgi:SAM-dependent methyltransferase
MFTEKRFEDAPEEIEKVLALIKPKGKAVLDLCCGPGWYSIDLVRKGFKVTGVDRTKSCWIKQKPGRKKLKQRLSGFRWTCVTSYGLRHMILYLVCSPSFGYFDNKHEDMAVLSNIYTSLKPGGVFLMELMARKPWQGFFNRHVRIYCRTGQRSLVIVRYSMSGPG